MGMPVEHNRQWIVLSCGMCVRTWCPTSQMILSFGKGLHSLCHDAKGRLAQVAMIPMLAWIARNAPSKYKATFFAVFASFTNVALSARELFTSYLNKIFVINREVVDQGSNEVLIKANYNDLDNLLISLIVITLVIPLITIYVIQKTKFKSVE